MVKIRYVLRRYGFLKFGILDKYTKTLLRNQEDKLILFNSKEEVKEFIKNLEN